MIQTKHILDTLYHVSEDATLDVNRANGRILAGDLAIKNWIGRLKGNVAEQLLNSGRSTKTSLQKKKKPTRTIFGLR
jgi:hypothetical protein